MDLNCGGYKIKLSSDLTEVYLGDIVQFLELAAIRENAFPTDRKQNWRRLTLHVNIQLSRVRSPVAETLPSLKKVARKAE